MKQLLLLALFALQGAPHSVRPLLASDPVGTDADDPAIWVNADKPENSLILGTDKTEAPNGGLYVFNLAGKVVQKIGGIDRPNNVDVEYGFDIGGRKIDIAVLTERKQHRLRIFEIDKASGQLTDISGNTAVLKEETDERSEPMGIGLYRNPSGVVDAIISPKTGPKDGYLAQYRLTVRDGKVDATEVRRFGLFSGEGEIESVLVDDEMGFVYCSDEGAGIRKYNVDPSKPAEELALFGTTGYGGDREGLAIFGEFLLSTDQVEGGSITHVYRRGGKNEPVTRLAGGADSTDGCEATSVNLGGDFSRGLFVTMNSKDKNFLVYTGTSLESAIRSR